MPQKRKQRDKDSSVPKISSSSKRCKATPMASMPQASHITKSDLITPPVARYLAPVTDARINSTANLTGTANHAANLSTTALPGKYPGQSHLVPRGERRTAKVGHKDETLLRMLCDDHNAGEVKELHFRNLPHSSIDWNNAEHIHKINNWRNQIYGRAGFKSKAVTMWLPDEELWFELYFQLSIAESTMRGILLPKNSRVLEAFNNTFVDRIIRDQNGQEILPRAARQINAFASKFNRMCPELRAQLKQCTLGMSGDVFVPNITLQVLHAYKKVKAELEESGLEQCAYSEHLQEWCDQFAQHPDNSLATTPKKQLSMAEDDAAAVLVSLSQESGNSEGEEDVLQFSGDGANNKAIEEPSNSTVQKLTAPWNKQDDPWSSPEQPSSSSSIAFLQQLDTPVTPPNDCSFLNSADHQFQYQRSATPVQELDISSLIASPD